jgi:hypothetical protein
MGMVSFLIRVQITRYHTTGFPINVVPALSEFARRTSTADVGHPILSRPN